MGHLAVNNSILDRYFKFLTKFDDNSKKRLIDKLTESLEKGTSKTNTKISNLFGAWIDENSSDKIIEIIRDSRVEKHKLEDF